MGLIISGSSSVPKVTAKQQTPKPLQNVQIRKYILLRTPEWNTASNIIITWTNPFFINTASPRQVVVFLMAVVCCVMAKPAVIAYSAPYVAEPASAIIESTYHGVSGAYFAAPVAAYAAAAPYVAAYSPYTAAYTTLLR